MPSSGFKFFREMTTILKPLHIGILESSCSPRTHPWQPSEWTPSLSPIRQQNWAESRVQAFPIIWFLGKPLISYVGQDVYWVWNNKQFAVWNVHHTVGNDELKDVHVHWTKPSWLSLADVPPPPAVTIQTGVYSHFIVFARDNLWCSKEKVAMLEIHHLSLEYVFHDINTGKVICQVLH